MTRSTRSYVLRMEVLTPLSVGSGRERGALREALRVPVMTSRGLEHLPVIPSSSLKGAFRGIGEMLGRSWGETSDDPRMRVMASHRRSGGIVSHEIREEMVEGLMSGLSDEERAALDRKFKNVEERAAYFCPICRLFGAPGISASVRFSDALPTRFTMQRVTRTSIDRERLKVVEESLFSDEVVSPGSEFRAVMLADVPEGSLEEKLLEMIMKFSSEVGLQLGGGKSVGRGRIRIIGLGASHGSGT